MRTLSPLHLKLFRDLRRLWPQVIAIALVLAAGVATLVLGVGATRALTDTRDAYYATNRFADVFATVTRAPRSLEPAIAAIDGVLAVDLGIRRLAVFDVDGFDVPGTALLVSTDAEAGPGLNQVWLRTGHMPSPGAEDEVVVSEGFARAHGFSPGDRFHLILNGHRQEVRITGTGLSPEFVYALGPGEMMPDESRFAIVWMPRAVLAAAYDLDGAFSDAFLQLAPGVSPAGVIDEVDRILKPYGGTGATGREDQQSHAFLQAELTQLQSMTRVLPPVFLAVAAFLVNITLGRLVALEREQVGLFKALGYSSAAVAWHYVEFALAVALIGIILGLGAGAWMGAGLARLYAKFFSFPWLVFSRDPSAYGLAALVALIAALGGALGAGRAAARLPPAVAMAPPAPALYQGGARRTRLRQTTVMTLRHLRHSPLRTAASTLGLGLAVAMLVGSFWSYGSIERMIDVTFFRAATQDATLNFAGDRPYRAAFDAAHLPGVLAAEPFRAVPVRLSAGPASRRIALVGRPADTRMSRSLDDSGAAFGLPDRGLVLSSALAEILGLRPGDRVRVERLDGNQRVMDLPVSALGLGYLGLTAEMDLGALNRALGDPPLISGVNLQVDPAAWPDLYSAIKAAPDTGFLALRKLSVDRFRATMAENIGIMIAVYGALAAVIAVGLTYNFARIALSEQGRELASLRVLGFDAAEVGAILYGEIAAVVLLAQPLGWAIGWLFAAAMAAGFDSDLYRVPLVVNREVFAWSSLIVMSSAVLSGLLVRRRIATLDLIEVLKTRE